ncbi:uncharacterized protein LOC142334060 [Lycorma delicatula]|uniref:uncharacterized protein LOC142334060 n=1 Tax=Lycorma delicatula TaxID=130591 RepID=UPI003F515566
MEILLDQVVMALLPVHPSIIRQWLRAGEIDKLEQIVLEGQGHKLLGQHSPDPNVRRFLKAVPAYLALIDMLHESVTRGHLLDLQTLLKIDNDNTNKASNNDNDNNNNSKPPTVSRIRGGGMSGTEVVGARRRHKLKRGVNDLVLCRDQSGVGLLHKAVIYNHQDIVKWLSKDYPLTMVIRDKDKRTALHYCGQCEEPNNMWGILVSNGADTNVVDSRKHTPAYYMDHPNELVLPSSSDSHTYNNNTMRYINNSSSMMANRELNS